MKTTSASALLGLALLGCGQTRAPHSMASADGGSGGQSGAAGSPSTGLASCPPIENAFGFGFRIEGQCAPSTYEGEGRVTSAEAGDYYVALEGPAADCLVPPRLWLAAPSAGPQPALVVDQVVNVSARLELDEAGRHAYRYVVLRDADSLALLFAEYSYDDRFFENGVLKVGSDLELSLQATCEFSAPCYQEAVRFELVDPTRSLRAGEFESTDFQIEANDYTFYVTGARSQTGFVANGECPAGHYTPGFQIFFDVLAH